MKYKKAPDFLREWENILQVDYSQDIAILEKAGEIKEAVRALIDHLPDSISLGQDCWNELTDADQEAVKGAREKGLEILKIFESPPSSKEEAIKKPDVKK